MYYFIFTFLISLEIKFKTRKIRLKKNIIFLKDTFIIESLIHSLKELDKNNQYTFYLNVKKAEITVLITTNSKLTVNIFYKN